MESRISRAEEKRFLKNDNKNLFFYSVGGLTEPETCQSLLSGQYNNADSAPTANVSLNKSLRESFLTESLYNRIYLKMPFKKCSLLEICEAVQQCVRQHSQILLKFPLLPPPHTPPTLSFSLSHMPGSLRPLPEIWTISQHFPLQTP